MGVRWGLVAEGDRLVVEVLGDATGFEQPIRASALMRTMKGVIHGRRNGVGAD
jgi:hypothetical protein